MKSTDGSFNLPARYKYLKLIGNGTYGTVISALDQEQKKKVAIKKLREINDIVDAKRILREIRILKYLKHENILGLSDLIYIPHPHRVVGEIYLVTDLLETDLHRILKTSHIQLEDQHIKYITYQLMKALHYIHTANIIHRDLKPSNILVNESCDIKICDFGLSRQLSMDKKEVLTEYVVTRHYRAPEIMLSSHHYSKEVDIWSVGCTLAEMLTRKILFPGEHYLDQINMIMELCGTPDIETLNLITNEYAKKYVSELPLKKKLPISSLIKYPVPAALDLLEKMLELNPHRRITAEQALLHPYLAEFHDPTDEPSFTGTLDFSFENNQKLSLVDIVKMILAETQASESMAMST